MGTVGRLRGVGERIVTAANKDPWRGAAVIASILGAVASLGVIQQLFIFPALSAGIFEKVNERIAKTEAKLTERSDRMEELFRAELIQHSSRPHADAVHRWEIDAINKRLDSLATKALMQMLQREIELLKEAIQGR